MKLLLASISMLVGVQSLVAQQCQTIAPAERFELERFVKKWYHLPDNKSVILADSSSVDSECYRKLIFRASVPAPPLVLYLTPDKTRLVSGVMDLAVDPAMAQQKAQNELAERLASGAVLTSGPGNAPVTLVVFSDFQCPYCKQFADILSGLRPDERDQLQIIYRQYPLNIHPWASAAAQMSTCAALQDKGAFWKLHDFYFENQQALSKETILIKSADFLKQSEMVDRNKLSTCLTEKQFQPVLQGDEALAIDVGVKGTPTVFLNGRIIAVHTIEGLRAAIQSEAGKAHDTASLPTPVPVQTSRH